ncbi:MarR family winged helix-turn-helix transcriptional regulator [Micromonospora rubida]|uniref:MarR family winged helix-turn-helix transcriptional regulator n=1 Tax=Micromonospora rubida TaxID=2697657 RepID=UPI00137668FD|nr:MarR family transcriptional regulator [Micromonospora rubida]NBE83494.1 MarR family transcriptional regulator [Micromonospora rubida]
MTTDVPAGGSADPLVDALVRNAFQVMGVLTRIGAEHDLSLTQLRVFGLLRDRRPRMTELATFLGLDKSTMSGLIDRAERRGLLARGRSAEDRRAVDVFLTAAGFELTERLYGEVRAALLPATGRLDPEQRHRLAELIEPILTPVTGAGEPSPKRTPARRPELATD